mgnify:CR=1 FL=1
MIDFQVRIWMKELKIFHYSQDQENKDTKAEPQEEVIIDDISIYEEKPQVTQNEDNTLNEVSPQLFSDEGVSNTSSEGNNDEILKSDEEEDFEIPAFLRKQKF